MRKYKCGNDVARNAKSCPKCGHRFTSGAVKFLTGFIILTFGAGVFAAMVASHTDPQPVIASNPAPAAPAKPVAKPTPAEMIVERKEYAKLIDKQVLDMGIESETFTDGPQAKTLVIKDALAGRVRANAIQNNDAMFDNLRALQFNKLEYTNGFESDLNYDVYWKVQP